MKNSKNYSCSVSFLDLLFNMLLGFAALFVMAFAMINMKNDESKGKIDSKADFIVGIEWAKELDYDIDVYVEDPLGNLVCFKRREEGLLHLERDDLGHRNDTVMTPTGPQKFDLNKEYVTFRGYHPGEYCVNAHAYRIPDKSKCEVKVTVDKLNPSVKTVLMNSVELSNLGDERTLIRFTLDRDGNVVSSNTLFKRLVQGGKQ